MTRLFPLQRFHQFCALFISLLVTPLLSALPLDNLKLHSVGLKVSDVEISLGFYQGLLGLPMQGQTGDTVYLRLGDGPQYLSLSPLVAGDSPRITYIGLSADNFDSTAFIEQLKANGYKEGTPQAVNNAGRLGRANTYWTADGVLHFVDTEGVELHISPSNYCGSTSFDCNTVKDKPKGKLNLLGINHFTTFMANAPRAVSYYQTQLGLDILSYQGPTPALSVGDGLQFLMFVGPAQEGAPSNPANLHHVSFMVENFDVDGIFATLKDYGLTARPEGVSANTPLTYYVSLRMPARGGAEGGTPELYFIDPDGILLQVQDPSYCGGGGYLGDKC